MKISTAVGPVLMIVAESPIPLTVLVDAPGNWTDNLTAATCDCDAPRSRPTWSESWLALAK